jgi:predicted MPP superfamily phosphohydrolase
MKYLIIIVPLFALLIIGVGNYYLSKRFALFFPVISFKSYLWGFICTTILLLFGSQLFILSSNFFGRIVFMLGSVWVAVLLYLLLSVAVIDLVNLFVKISPIVRGAMSLILTALFIIYGVINASVIRVKEISVPIVGLTKEIKAVHISDIHLGNFWGKAHLEKIVDKAIELNPDIIFNTGDVFDSKRHFTENSDILKPFDKVTVPHYFVYGNHDEHVGLENVIERMKIAGAIILRNEISYFEELQIVGLDNMLEDENAFDMHTKHGAETIKSVMSKLSIEENKPTIVLHHRPAGFEYMDAKKVNLLLAGHTHGGQFFPITLIANIIYPYNEGLHKYNDMNIYVSQGVGTIFSPVRVWTYSEITLIKLVPKI